MGCRHSWLVLVLLLMLALVLGCGEGMKIEGKGTNDETDDDTGPTEPPPAPDRCDCTPQTDSQSILISWFYNTESFELVENFLIKRCHTQCNDASQWTTIAEPNPDTSMAYQQYEDTTVDCDVTYHYRIYAVNAAGLSDSCLVSCSVLCNGSKDDPGY